MPTYEYSCSACNHEFEAFQSIMAAPLEKCPQCAKHSIKRSVGGGAGILFKGTGFYQTDYRSEGYQKQASVENKSGTCKTSAEPCQKACGAAAKAAAGSSESPKN